MKELLAVGACRAAVRLSRCRLTIDVFHRWVMTWKNTSSTGLTTNGPAARRFMKSLYWMSCLRNSRPRLRWMFTSTRSRGSPYSRSPLSLSLSLSVVA